MVASTSSDAADTGPAASDALLCTFASVIATPAAAAVEPPVAAEPSAFEPRAAVSEDFTVSAPPTETAPPSTVAVAVASAIVTAIAAATDTGPDDVVADGVPVVPAPEPPLADDVELALERAPAT